MPAWADYRDGHFDSYVAYFPDYSMFVSPETLQVSGNDTLYVQFPEIKLYSSSVIVISEIEQPPTGTIEFHYPNGSILTSLPGEVPVVITASPEVPAGPYTYNVKAIGLNGTPVHKRTTTIEVLPLNPPDADFYADTTEFCAGGIVDFFDASENFPSSWEWNFPGGVPDTSTSQNPQGIIYDTSGIYSVTLIVSNIMGSDTLTKTDYIQVLEVPGPPTGDDQAVCQFDTVSDLFAEGENIKWYADAQLTDLLDTGNTYSTGMTDPGSYTYYVTQTTNGCESVAGVITLTIYELPEVSFDLMDSVCQDAGPIELTGGNPEGGEYSGTGVDQGIFDPLVSGTGTFDIMYTYTDTNGCTNIATVQVTVNEVPSVSLGADTSICEGTSIMLDAGPGQAFYNWSTGSTDQSITVAGEGQYWVMVTNFSGCTAYDTMNIAVSPLPGMTGMPVGPDTVDLFVNGSSEYTSLGAENADSYTWLLEPDSAGTIAGTGTTADVNWATGFNGLAMISILGINDCGPGDTSSVLQVLVYSSQGIAENNIGDIRIYPNPSNGTFILEISTIREKSLGIRIINTLGDVIYAKMV